MQHYHSEISISEEQHMQLNHLDKFGKHLNFKKLKLWMILMCLVSYNQIQDVMTYYLLQMIKKMMYPNW